MGKFNTYSINAFDADGFELCKGVQVQAISLESAWNKAIAFAFDACEPGTGMRPESIHVSRIKSPGESHG